MDGDPLTHAPKPPKDARVKRRRALILWGVSIVVAALGILLIASVGPILRGQKSEVGITTISPRQQSEALRIQAEDVLRDGETTAALSLARDAAAVDPTNAAARDLAARLANRSLPSPRSSGSTGSSQTTTLVATSTASVDAGYVRPVADLKALLPAGLSGYAFEPAIVTSDNASISASRQQPGAGAGHFIWTVRDSKSVNGARAFLRKTTKVLYGKHPAAVTVHGVPAYYGTDGERIATVTYARGRYVFELLLSAGLGSVTGARAAAAFRDTPVR